MVARSAPNLKPAKHLRLPKAPAAAKPDPVESARAAGLSYVNDNAPGIHRKKVGSGFAYVDARGRRVTDWATLARIKSLAIPPAWTDVWIDRKSVV